ncbi:DNA polymerase III subunit alpha [candidate division KSB1 bacterium]|nr:DNA polymerase III subunit alpha [candidate division KSB1 bacterium]
MSSFVHLHAHSNFSFCRGAWTIENMCRTAADMGMSHLALTDTNGVYGLGWFLQAARENGIQPVIGAQLVTARHHCVVLVRNHQGYHHLCRVIRLIHAKESFDLVKTILAHQEDWVVFTHDSALLHAVAREEFSPASFYAECVPHLNKEQVIGIAQKYGLPLLASNAVYFRSADDWPVHQLLRAIDLNTTLSRVPSEELVSPQAWFKSAQEMARHFPNHAEAMQNTQKVAHDCSFTFRFKDFIFANINDPGGRDVQSVLQDKVIKGAIWRYGSLNHEIQKRMNYELKLIAEKNFAPYFLVVADIVRQAPRTCGRGSAAASLASYCLGITHVDPIKYDLFFERFLNPGRKDPPDIDVDFPWDERDDILEYIFRKYGASCTAMISNHNSFKARSAVREIAKVFGIPEAEIGVITKKMTGYYQPHDILDLIRTHPVYKGITLDENWFQIIALAERIRGFPRHLSVHCGGVVIAPDGLDRYVPTQPAKKQLRLTGILDHVLQSQLSAARKFDIQVVQWEKDQSEELGLIKMDILGNRSLAVIRDTLEAIRKTRQIHIDYASWNPLDDPRTRDLIARGDTIGVFYVESPAMRQLQRKTQTGDFEHLVIHSSIIRPAANEYINEYVRRLKGGRYDPLHPLLQDILKETYGIMVYQEDISKVVMALAGFDAADADELRKVVSKKHKQKRLLDFKNQFYRGAQRNKVSPEVCDKIWDMIISFAGYSFCKPHSASYALVSFKSAYLKAHFPAEFMAAVISNQGGYYSAFAYLSEARRMGCKVLLPDINQSEICYTGQDDFIRIGFMQIKGLSRNAMQRIVTERKHQPFRSFDDFLSRTRPDDADAALLIKSGCFDQLESEKSRPELLWQLKWNSAHKKQKGPEEQQTLSLFEADSALPALPKPPQYSSQTIIAHEIETLGFLASRHPLSLYSQHIRRLDILPAKDKSLHIGENVRMIGWLITRKVVSTKNKELMEFVSFEDTTDIYEAILFPKIFNKFVHMMSRTRPYLLQGKIDSNHGAPCLQVDFISFLTPDREFSKKVG